MTKTSPLVWPQFDRATSRAVLDILRSGRVNYWTGSVGRTFEAAFADFLGVREATSVANGSLALELALLALGVGPGDDVIVTPYSFRASATCAARVGANMVFADVAEDHLLCAETIERVLTPKTKAVVVVHLYGQVVDMKPILALARRHRFFVIEDCAQCLGGRYLGSPVGTLGDVGCFSFCQSKHLTTGGEGGMVVARRADVARRVRSLRDHGWIVGSEPKAFDAIGTNALLTEIQSAIGLGELRRFKTWNAPRRAARAAAYMEALRDHPLVVSAPVDTPRRRASFWLMPFVLDPSRLACPVSTFIEKMQAEGAQVYKILWPLLAPMPVASRLVANTVGFWVHPTIPMREIRKTIVLFCRLARELGAA